MEAGGHGVQHGTGEARRNPQAHGRACVAIGHRLPCAAQWRDSAKHCCLARKALLLPLDGAPRILSAPVLPPASALRPPPSARSPEDNVRIEAVWWRKALDFGA